MLPEVAIEDLAAALDRVAAEILELTSVSEPPVDAVIVARRLGLSVAWDDRQSGRARLVKLAEVRGNQSPAILIKHDPRFERIQWAVAHEIGEACAERAFAELAIDAHEAPRQAREAVANGIANRLLLPTAWLAVDGPECDWDLVAIKERYATASNELIARRMLDFPTPVIVSVYDQDRLTWRRSNAGYRVPKPIPIEIAARRRAHEVAHFVVDDGPPRIRTWPIHEPEWQREIVRVELGEWVEDGISLCHQEQESGIM